MRTPEQLELARSQALEAWKQRRDVLEPLPEPPGSAREARQEAARRVCARDRERQALLSRLADAQAAHSRVVVAHRMAWMRAALRTGLEDAGLGPVEEVEDGATALGAVVAVQPDVVLVQQQLPWLDGLEVVRQIRHYAPDSLVVVQLDSPHAAGDAMAAGASLVLGRAERPRDVVAKLRELVA